MIQNTKQKIRKEQTKRDMVIDTAVSNVESPWSINTKGQHQTIINGDSE